MGRAFVFGVLVPAGFCRRANSPAARTDLGPGLAEARTRGCSGLGVMWVSPGAGVLGGDGLAEGAAPGHPLLALRVHPWGQIPTAGALLEAEPLGLPPSAPLELLSPSRTWDVVLSSPFQPWDVPQTFWGHKRAAGLLPPCWPLQTDGAT